MVVNAHLCGILTDALEKGRLHTKELRHYKKFFPWFMLPAFAFLASVTHLQKESSCEHMFLTLYFWQKNFKIMQNLYL